MLSDAQLVKLMRVACRRVKHVYLHGYDWADAGLWHATFMRPTSCWRYTTGELYVKREDIARYGLFVPFHELAHAMFHKGTVDPDEVVLMEIEANFVAMQAMIGLGLTVPYTVEVDVSQEHLAFGKLPAPRQAVLRRGAARIMRHYEKVLKKSKVHGSVDTHVEVGQGSVSAV